MGKKIPKNVFYFSVIDSEAAHSELNFISWGIFRVYVYSCPLSLCSFLCQDFRAAYAVAASPRTLQVEEQHTWGWGCA